jgi:hypothetical protein
MGTLTQLRNSIITSVFGRRLGFTVNEFLVGQKDLTLAIQSLTSANSTATSVLNYGMTILDVTTGAASTASSVGTTEAGGSWVMAAPEPGVRKIVMKVSATLGSTQPVVVMFAAAAGGVTAYDSSFQTSAGGIQLTANGQSVSLMGVTTAKWLVTSRSTGANVSATA